MSRTRQILSTVVGTVLLMLVAGPAAAGPAPLGEGGGGNGRVPGPSANSDPSIWMYVGLSAAGLLVIAAIAFTAVALDRHAHHAPQPV
ncbi:MAG: hypothetical protein ACRDWY_08570 [Actinomycetes bacterium]